MGQGVVTQCVEYSLYELFHTDGKRYNKVGMSTIVTLRAHYIGLVYFNRVR